MYIWTWIFKASALEELRDTIVLPYSGLFSRGVNFRLFSRIEQNRQNKFRQFKNVHAKVMLKMLNPTKFFVYPFQWKSRNFTPAKITRYTVIRVCAVIQSNLTMYSNTEVILGNLTMFNHTEVTWGNLTMWAIIDMIWDTGNTQ